MDKQRCRLAEAAIRRVYTHATDDIRIIVDEAVPELSSIYGPIVESTNIESVLADDIQSVPDFVITREDKTTVYVFVVPTYRTINSELTERLRSAASEEASRAVLTYPSLTAHCSELVQTATSPSTEPPSWFGAVAKAHGGSPWTPVDGQDIPVVTHRNAREELLDRFGTLTRQRYVLHKPSYCYAR